MSSIHSIKSNARRAARKAGIDPELVYAVPEGWKCPDAPSTNAEPAKTVGEVFAAAIETVAAAPAPAGNNPKTCPKCSAVFGTCDHTKAAPAHVERIETVAAQPIKAPDSCPQCIDETDCATAPICAAIEHSKANPIIRTNTATALVADLDAKAAKRVKAKPIKPTKPAKTVKPKLAPKVRGKRDGVCNKVIEAIHARWTSVDELLKLSGWQRHTLRGYISTRASKDGFTVEKRKVDGVSQYRVERAA